MRQNGQGGGNNAAVWLMGLILAGTVFACGIGSIVRSDVFHSESNRAESNVVATQEAMHVAQTATPAAAYWDATRQVLRATMAPQEATAAAQARQEQAMQLADAQTQQAQVREQQRLDDETRRVAMLRWADQVLVVALVFIALALTTWIIVACVRVALQHAQQAVVAEARQAERMLAHATLELNARHQQLAEVNITYDQVTSQIAHLVLKRNLLEVECDKAQQAQELTRIDTERVYAHLQTLQQQLVEKEVALQNKHQAVQGLDVEIAHHRQETERADALLQALQRHLGEMEVAEQNKRQNLHDLDVEIVRRRQEIVSLDRIKQRKLHAVNMVWEPIEPLLLAQPSNHNADSFTDTSD
jgi:hypothetical protein